MDSDGRYYYQYTRKTQDLVPLWSQFSNMEMGDKEQSMKSDIERNQTGTPVPLDSRANEEGYLIVIEQVENPVVNIGFGNDLQNRANPKETIDNTFLNKEGKKIVANENKEVIHKRQQKKNVEDKSKQNNKLLTCPSCPYSSNRRYLLLRHMKTHPNDRTHKCNVCDRGFKTNASLQNHVNVHTGHKPHICTHCNSPFTTSGELVRHVRYKHTHEKPHKCRECDYASVELSKLRRHIRCHTGERPYQCPHCTYASSDTFKLKRHLRTHTGEKPYQCVQCKMCFTQANSLKTHQLLHNVSERPVFACELCPAKCNRKSDLRTHVQNLHNSNKPSTCRRCGKCFPDKYSCIVHSKTHVGEKTFRCGMCSYASELKRHLTAHMYTHSQEKPFACDECEQAFRQKQLLRRHINIYHVPGYQPAPPKEKTHVCNECDKMFAHKGNLVRHMVQHDVELQEEKSKKSNKGRRKEKLSKEPEQAKNPTISDIKCGEIVTVTDGEQFVLLQVIEVEDDEADEKGLRKLNKLVEDTASNSNNMLDKGIDMFFGFDEEHALDGNKYN